MEQTPRKHEQNKSKSFEISRLANACKISTFILHLISFASLIFPLKNKKNQPNKQKNKRINIVKIAAQRGSQAEESYWEQKQLERDRRKKKRTKWNLSMTSTDADKVRQTWVRVKFWRRGEKKKRSTKRVETCRWNGGKSWMRKSSGTASSPSRTRADELITNTWEILHYYSEKRSDLEKHKTRGQPECPQSLHSQKTKKNTRRLSICMQPAHVTAFRLEYRNESGPESFSISPSHCAASSYVTVWMCFYEISLLFFSPCEKKVDTLRHCILSPQPSLQSKWRLCDCFSDSFSLLPWFGAVLMLRRKNTLLFLSPHRWICYQQFAA